MTIALLLLLALGPQAVRPPMHRAWTELSDDSTEVLDIRDSTLVYCSHNKVRAIDIRTGAKKWSREFSGQMPQEATINGNAVYVDMYAQGKPYRIISIDRKTGVQKEFGQSYKGENSRHLACDEKRLYLLENGVLRAVDLASKKQVWRDDLKKGKKGRGMWMASLTAKNGRVFAGIDQLGFHSIDAATGRVFWQENAPYGVYDAPLVLAGGVLTGYKGLRLQDFTTGKPIWTSPLSGVEPAAVDGNWLLGNHEARPCAIDIATGKTAWEWPKPERGYTHGGGPGDDIQFGNAGGFVTVFQEEDRRKNVVRRVDRSGHELWSVPVFFDGDPIYLDDHVMVCYDHERLLGYAAGAAPAVPGEEAGQRALAQKLVKDFELLDLSERNTFEKVGKYASKELIAKYALWAKDNRDNGPADREGRGQRLYGLLSDTPYILDSICGPGDTEALLAAIATLDETNSYRGALTKVLGKRGDPARSIPIFIEKLKKSRGNDRDSDASEALTAVAESTDPVAVKFMIAALDDSKSPTTWRREAFTHLAGTGGTAGVEAVKRARAKRGPRPTWQSRLSSELESKDVLSELKDAKGSTWRLIHSRVLGNSGDLYMQQKSVSGWNEPIFLGVSTGRTFSSQAPKEYKGVGINKLVESEWVKMFPADTSIVKDADADGLTDLVEARLGTNPNKADMDGDGLKDAVDPCPTAAPRPLGDREKVIEACVEAHFFAYGYALPPANIQVEGVEPFEMYGYAATLIWPAKGAAGGLSESYGAGMNSIGIHPPMKDFREDTEGKELIEFSDGGKSAETLISRYSGGLNGEGMAVKLKKVGDEWFVTSIQGRYVS